LEILSAAGSGLITIAVAQWLVGDGSLGAMLVDKFNWCLGLSYGGGEPYNSYGNGAAMRGSAVGHFACDESDCLFLAADSAAVAHRHH
jgi:hypothetical protein